MADTEKAQKLAQARKKVNKYKKLKEEKRNLDEKNEETINNGSSKEQTPVESLTNSTHSSLNEQNQQLPNYFTNYQEQPQQTASFFDNFINTNKIEGNQTIFPQQFPNFDVTGNSNQNQSFDNNLRNYFNDNLINSVPTIINQLKNDEINYELESTDNLKDMTQHSTVESLLQLSNEMDELIEPNLIKFSTNSNDLLEKRNQELALLLENEKLRTEQLTANLKEYETKIKELELEISTKKSIKQSTDELNNLKTELQNHIQTIGILVAEKTELSVNLNQIQLILKQKTEECNDLQGRLKTSRLRVSDLERELNQFKQEKINSNNLDQLNSNNLKKLETDYKNLIIIKDELEQDLLETREKLKSNQELNLKLNSDLNELNNQLSMANIKIQQLTTNELTSNEDEIIKLTDEKFQLEKNLQNLNLLIKNLQKEKDESNLQYHQYAQQLNTKLTNLMSKIDELQNENDQLQLQGQNRIKHISELEKQLQNLQNEQILFTTTTNNNQTNSIENNFEELNELIKNLQIEKNDLNSNYEKLFNEHNLLINELELKKQSIQQLEEINENIRKNQPDHVKLLATMQSDKVAASRALLQNEELKKQMDGMQEVFMKLSNDKVELTDKLSTEQQNNRELLEKLQKTEIHLQTLADAIEIKDKELSNLRKNSNELDKKIIESEQLNDRLRHYEAHDHSSHSLQNELQESKQLIVKLTNEINKLQETKRNEDNIVDKETDNSESNSIETDVNHEHDNNSNILSKEDAMKSLEKKFLRTMDDIATLTEEKQRLEHLVLQLQSETETIGEYVALYQLQRGLLKQKAIEKDQQLTQLEHDRKLIKFKLDKLNELIKKLVIENGKLPNELLENDHNLCEEHAKIQNEINKITTVDNIDNNYDLLNKVNADNSETANEIIALLTEIKSSNLVQPTDDIHPCPWCSGKLITV